MEENNNLICNNCGKDINLVNDCYTVEETDYNGQYFIQTKVFRHLNCGGTIGIKKK